MKHGFDLSTHILITIDTCISGDIYVQLIKTDLGVALLINIQSLLQVKG